LNVAVRVNSPGDNGPVDQRNTSSAAAVAASTPPAGASASTPTATATSTQVAPTNVNVSVRVGSPGADASRTQVNSSAATSTIADPTTVAPTVGTLPDPADANSAAEVDNASSVVQNLAQCGDACPMTQTQRTNGPENAASSTANAGTAAATATQTAPSNVDVSVRVGSPGASGSATQVNVAPASGTPAVSTITAPNNLSVTVVVPGAPGQVVVPSGTTPWVWNWTWTTGAAPADPAAAATSSSTWQWTWTAPGDSPATTTGAAQPQNGQWTWTWTWTRADGSTTTWTYSQACACSWAWTWSWTWPAAPANPAPAPSQPSVPAPQSNPTVDQTNEASATAVAVTTFTGTQSNVPTGSTSASADQAIASDQTAVASADVAQTRPLNQNVVTAGEMDGVAQENGVAGTAIADALDQSSQALSQQQAATDDGAAHTLTAAQRIATVQTARAGVAAAQTDATNLNQVWSTFGPSKAKLGQVTQTNVAETVAIADVESAVQQVSRQSQTGGGADQDASATQIATTAQAQDASSSVSQARVANVNDVAIPLYGSWSPPLVQSNHVSAVSVSYATSEISQTITQIESGDGIEWHANATQTADVKQSGTAWSGASQSGRTNTSGWRGLVSVPVSSTPTTGAQTQVAVPRPRLTLSSPYSSGSASATASPQGLDSSAVTLVAAWVPATRHVRATPPALVLATRTVRTWPSSSSPLSAKSQRSGEAEGSSSTSPRQTPLPSRHNLNLIGTMSSAPPALLPAAFAALLAPIELAAPGVGRLQHDAPVLGRPVDISLRERPG
jgi:hypothetical protein